MMEIEHDKGGKSGGEIPSRKKKKKKDLVEGERARGTRPNKAFAMEATCMMK